MNSTRVKYAVANNSIYAKEPNQVTTGSTGYDLFAAEEKLLLPQCTMPITIELKMEIPCGYFGKVYPRSSLLKNCFGRCDDGVIGSNFYGTVLILMTNNSKDQILIKADQRISQISQIVFHEKVVFKKFEFLSSTERGARSFGSRGI